MEYKIKISSDREIGGAALNLQRWVNDAIECGFKPQGQFQIVHEGGFYTLLQQMIKED